MSCFNFLLKCWKVLNLLCFFSTQIDHLNGLKTIVKLWTYCLWETALSKRIKDSQHLLSIEFPRLAQLSTIPHNFNEAAELNPIYKNESHSALWHNLAQLNSTWHPVHYWAQYGLVWHIIKAAYLNPITKTSPLVQFEKIQLNLPQFGTVVHHTSQNLCCRTDCYAQNWVMLPNLGGFSTIWHFNISFWGKYMTKL